MENVKVKKRNGELQDFDFNKIKVAITKAFKNVGVGLIGDEADNLFARIESKLHGIENHGVIDLENIQDLNETTLMEFGYLDVAKAYILYRYKRKQARDKLFEQKLLGKKIDNQNANVDEYSFGGRIGEAARVMTKDYGLYHCMSKMARENHLNNEIYCHDLDSLASGQSNCLSMPIDNLFATGFKVKQTDIRPVNSINTAFQLLAVLFQLQSLNQFGGVSCTHLDWSMVPYMRKSFYKHLILKLIYREIKDKMSIDNLNNDNLKKKLETKLCNQYNIKQEPYNHGLTAVVMIPNLAMDDKRKRAEIGEELWDEAYYETVEELRQAVEGMYHNLNSLQSRSGNQLNKVAA